MKTSELHEHPEKVSKNDFWESHYQQYKKSNLSKTKYSRQHNLSAPQFIYWSHKFEAKSQMKPATAPNFIEVKMQSELPNKSYVGLCTLELGNAKRLIIHDMGVMKTLLHSLGVN